MKTKKMMLKIIVILLIPILTSTTVLGGVTQNKNTLPRTILMLPPKQRNILDQVWCALMISWDVFWLLKLSSEKKYYLVRSWLLYSASFYAKDFFESLGKSEVPNEPISLYPPQGATNVNPHNLTLSWDGQTGNISEKARARVSYRVELSPEYPPPSQYGTTNEYYVVTDLKPDTKYYWAVTEYLNGYSAVGFNSSDYYWYFVTGSR